MAAPAAAAEISLVTLVVTLSAQRKPPGAVESHTQVRPVAGSVNRWPLSLGSAVQPCELEAGVWSVALAAAMLAVAVAV